MDSPAKKSRWKLPLIILAATAVIVGLLVITKPEPPTITSTEKAWLVETETVAFSAHHPQISLLGTVQSPFDITVSSSIQADVYRVPVREGQRVEQGEVLIELDQQEIGSLVTQRQADVNELEASIKAEFTRYKADQRSLEDEKRLLEVANKAYKRQSKLKSAQLVAQERIEQAESQVAQSSLSVTARQRAIDEHPTRLKQLEARLKRAKALLDIAQLDLDRAQVKAPFSGIVTSVPVAPGDRVQVGQALVGLYDATEIEIRAQLPDRHLSHIRKALDHGYAISGEASLFGQSIPLALARMGGQTETGAGGIDAFFVPGEGSHFLPLHSTVRIQANLPQITNTMVLPISALYGTNRVYRVEEDRIQAVEVQIKGHQLDQAKRSHIIISPGDLKPGDQVITTQLPNAISGLKVTFRENRP